MITKYYTSDGYTYDCKIYKFICTNCQYPFHTDKVGNYCPNCGIRLGED